ncbi:hypothetical protein CHS0354_002549, partial [Potamilus streckersoni]
DHRTCPDEAFQCSDGQSVSAGQFCDHIKDCKDGSEESCAYRECGLGEFRCNNGQCILKEELCDARHNCYDDSDEKLCGINGFLKKPKISKQRFGCKEIVIK